MVVQILTEKEFINMACTENTVIYLKWISKTLNINMNLLTPIHVDNQGTMQNYKITKPLQKMQLILMLAKLDENGIDSFQKLTAQIIILLCSLFLKIK